MAEVSQAITNDGRFQVTPIRCHARTAIAIESTRRQDGDHPEALLYRAELREGV